MKKLIVVLMLLTSCSDPGRAVLTPGAVPAKPMPSGVTLVAADQRQFDQAARSNPSTLLLDAQQPRKVQGVLSLPLDDGTFVKLEDNSGTPHDEDRLSHTYLGRETVLRKHVVEQKAYERTEILLIDMRSGKLDTLPGLPHVSPNGAWVFSTAFDPYETADAVEPPTQDIRFYSVANGRLEQLHAKAYKLFVTGQAWSGAHTLLIRYHTPNPDEGQAQYAAFEIGREPSNRAPLSSMDADAWAGRYYVSVEGEETTTTTSMIAYVFTVSADGATLETTTTHEPISCNGRYRISSTEGVLRLDYDGDDASCRKQALPFEIRKAHDAYFIRGVGGEGSNRQWRALARET